MISYPAVIVDIIRLTVGEKDFLGFMHVKTHLLPISNQIDLQLMLKFLHFEKLHSTDDWSSGAPPDTADKKQRSDPGPRINSITKDGSDSTRF